jgi:hypothetical protein
MNRKSAARFVFAAMMAMTGCIHLNAQTPAPVAPIVTLAQSDGQTVHQSDGLVLMQMNASDPVGLHSVGFSGAYSSAISQFTSPPRSAALTLYFYVSYFPVGDYTFHATAVNTSGLKTDKFITIRLVK